MLLNSHKVNEICIIECTCVSKRLVQRYNRVNNNYYNNNKMYVAIEYFCTTLKLCL